MPLTIFLDLSAKLLSCNTLMFPPPLQAAGAALAYVGAYVIKSYNNFDHFIQDKYTLIPAAIIIGVAVVMFIFGLVGCCATIRESKVGLSFVGFCVCVCVCVCDDMFFFCSYIFTFKLLVHC